MSKEIDKEAKHFGTYDIVKARVDTDMKITSSLRKKDKIVKKLKAQHGVNDEEDNEEDAEEQGPLAITQGLSEDTKEGDKQEKDEEAKQAPPVEKKRKSKAPPKPK